MEKHLLTALLVLVLVAPQTGLEAKSRHHGVKDRDNDAEERDHEDKKRYHKSKKRHHKSKKHHHSWRKFIRLARATKEELTTTLALLQADIDALVVQIGVTPDELAAALAPLREDIDANTTNVTLALEDITNIRNVDIADINLELASIIDRLGALESPGPSESDLLFSGFFISGFKPGFDIMVDWHEFRSNATGSFSSLEIRNSLGGSVVCDEPAVVDSIVKEFNAHVPTVGAGPGDVISYLCFDPASIPVEWNIGACNGEVELNAGLGTKEVCGNSEGAVVRPLIGNSSWGGVGTDFGGSGGTTSAPSQTLEVILTR